jgi:8-oxo-dGTP pyrophosphatase MutT (NUDIX family)
MIRSVGTILFQKNKILLVKDNNNFYSFPKGHKFENETDLQTAFRELKEETGLNKEDIKLFQKNDNFVSYFERLDKNLYNRYFIGLINKTNHNYDFNLKEIKEVELFNIEDIYKINNFKDTRIKLAKKAYYEFMN